MLIGHLWLNGLALIALPFLASCGGQDTNELADLRTAVGALQQEIESVGADVANLTQRTEANGQMIGDISSQIMTLSEALDSIVGATAELEQKVTSLGGAVEEQHAGVTSRLISRIHELEAELNVLAAELRKPDEEVFTLQLLHAWDMDGSVGALANVENFSAILDGFRRQFPGNTLVLSTGDNYAPGQHYFAADDDANAPVLGVSGAGRRNIALLNAMGFQASAMGNHELDRGTAAFAATIGFEANDDGTYAGAMFPYLSGNLVFADDENLADMVVPSGQEGTLVASGLARSAVITVDGERIGIVGATTPALEVLTGVGGISILPASGDIVELTAIIQHEVNVLVGQGVNKVILQAHMQRIDLEKEFAMKLLDVDIIVAGGSNTLLADATDRLRPGDEAADVYPLLFESPKGEPLLLVNTDGDYRYLGRLVVDFDERGLALPESIDPHVSGACATDRQGGEAFAGRPIPEVTRIAQSLRRVLRDRDGTIVGKTSVYLAGDRRDVRTQETNLGNLTADANLWFARQIDAEVAVSLKNGGAFVAALAL